MPLQKPLPYLVEPMSLADVDQVMVIEQLAFSAPWSARAYRYEVAENEHSTMLVVRQAPPGVSSWLRLLRRLHRSRSNPVLGYGGFWLLVDEAHIATIAVHPEWRGCGLGELLLLSMLDRGRELGARLATLEVRVSNHRARQLYEKYGFYAEARRRRYYTDNNEDAILMSTPSFDTAEFQENLRRCRAELYTRLRNDDPRREARTG
jgi:ribosomal-protein-alanine N-acetyltransferase